MPSGSRLGQASLGEVRQLQVVEEEVEELLAGEDEAEGVLAFAVPAALGSALPPPLGGRLIRSPAT